MWAQVFVLLFITLSSIFMWHHARGPRYTLVIWTQFSWSCFCLSNFTRYKGSLALDCPLWPKSFRHLACVPGGTRCCISVYKWFHHNFHASIHYFCFVQSILALVTWTANVYFFFTMALDCLHDDIFVSPWRHFLAAFPWYGLHPPSF